MSRTRKVQLGHIITKGELSYQSVMIDMMQKLIDETRQNSSLLRQVIQGEVKIQKNNAKVSTQNIKKNQPIFNIRSPTLPSLNHNKDNVESPNQKAEHEQLLENWKKEESQPQLTSQSSDFKNFMLQMQTNMADIASTNKKLYQKLSEKQEKQVVSHKLIPQNMTNEQSQNIGVIDKQILKLVHKGKEEKQNYGIISEIMPFSDKREIKVRFKIIDLINSKDLTKIDLGQVKAKTSQWVGMVFRATASICWNMLLGGTLTFQQVKVLFTENIIFNFIEFMNDIEDYLSQDDRLKLTAHINDISCQVLQFLCKQYPQTKVEAPNIALRKSIPLIQNQGQAKVDIVAMVSRDGVNKLISHQEVRFQFRQDKDYSSVIMKTVNYMIEKTDEQFNHFEKTMINIFEKIYISKDKRDKISTDLSTSVIDAADSQYREKVSGYSSYLIGRKISKNTQKYSENQIEYGVFFVKSPSILRIITKWVEELWQFVNTPLQNMKNNSNQIKDQTGKVLNMQTRVKNALYLKVNQKLEKIKTKISRIRQQCYHMELLLTGPQYTTDELQTHLSQDQLSVGKFCSNLKNAISGYISSQLSKIIYYLMLIPKQINEVTLNFNDEDIEEQARKHLDRTNLVTLKIFDLLRCKCHSNEQQIIWIVQELKRMQINDDKFEIVRVKDRLNQGTRDILINAQYDGGLVWEIQLAVTSQIDKKQDMLDKYNHFLYQLKRAKLGPISECVTIWATLQQRSSYFQLIGMNKLKKKKSSLVAHKRSDCSTKSLVDYSQFKRPLICQACRQYYAIPQTALLNVRCEKCRVTYCGQCFYGSLSDIEKKKFMFQNFEKKKLMNSSAFQQLIQVSNFMEPFPKEGFFISKKFLNKQLCYFTAVITETDKQNKGQFQVSISQTFIKNGKLHSRRIHQKQIKIIEVNGQYFLKNPKDKSCELRDYWFFYFRNRRTQKISLIDLQLQIKNPQNARVKYLNLLFQPNYINQLHLIKKMFQKSCMVQDLKQIKEIEKQYKIAIHRFSHFVILAQIEIEEEALKRLLIKKQNQFTLRGFIERKVTIINMQQSDVTNEFDDILIIKSDQALLYLQRIQKVYLADNDIADISCMSKFKNLQSLSISKNCLKNLNGIQNLMKLYYVKFDDNQISNLQQLTLLVNLTYISGNLNKIKSLKGIENLQKLGSFSLCTNQLKDIKELGYLTSLSRIYLRQNPIQDIQPLNNMRIHHLFLGGTKINPMDISKLNTCDKLKEVALKDLNMKEIPKIFDKMVNLNDLKLCKNQIKRIQNLSKTIKLIHLDLSDNQIQKIQNLQNLQILEQLKLKNNKITVVEGVKTFIEALKIINLENNPLNDLSHYLIYEQKLLFMRLKYSEDKMTAQARTQLRNHAIQISNKSQSDD